jgi:hypothetical protein
MAMPALEFETVLFVTTISAQEQRSRQEAMTVKDFIGLLGLSRVPRLLDGSPQLRLDDATLVPSGGEISARYVASRVARCVVTSPRQIT